MSKGPGPIAGTGPIGSAAGLVAGVSSFAGTDSVASAGLVAGAGLPTFPSPICPGPICPDPVCQDSIGGTGPSPLLGSIAGAGPDAGAGSVADKSFVAGADHPSCPIAGAPNRVVSEGGIDLNVGAVSGLNPDLIVGSKNLVGGAAAGEDPGPSPIANGGAENIHALIEYTRGFLPKSS
ncbi:hypothetical protein MMC07_005408 [Pseudocyphellaria aurata]|nr:hypothetical protein [Pseudocyphellaria aurata]